MKKINGIAIFDGIRKVIKSEEDKKEEKRDEEKKYSLDN